MKKIILIIIIITLILMPLVAQDSNGFVKVGLYAGAKPVSFIGNDGMPAGLYYDLLKHILEFEGYLPIFIMYEKFTDLYEAGKNGDVDIMAGLIKTPEREKDFYYSDIYINSTWSQVFVLGSSEINVIHDLIGKRVGLMSGGQNGIYLVEMMDGFDFDFLPVYYDSFPDAIDAMRFGYVDAIAAFNLLATTNQDIIGTSIMFNPSGISISTAIDISPETKELLNKIDEHLTLSKQDHNSLYYDFLHKWLTIEIIENTHIPVLVYLIIGVILTILFITFIIIILLRVLVDRKTEDLKELNNSLEFRVEQQTEILLQQEKLASIGRLVAGLAHEMNTPLGMSLTSSTFTESKLDNFNNDFINGELSEEDFVDYISQLKQSSEITTHNISRAIELINVFRDISLGSNIEEIKSFYINTYIEALTVGFKLELRKHNNKIELNIVDEKIKSYSRAISQIVTNFITNSLTHGLTENGLITIDGYSKDGIYYLIYKDNGRGIDENIVDNIYEPFFTTRRAEGSTGLGLNIIYNTIVNTLNGTINYSYDDGAKFTITFPLGD